MVGVSPSGFYAWCKRGRSAHQARDEALSVRIREAHERSHATYGAPRIHAELTDTGVSVSRKRIPLGRTELAQWLD